MAKWIDKKKFGWAGHLNSAREWDRIGHLFAEFKLISARPRASTVGVRVCAWDATKSLLGKWLEHVEQLIGDCVGVGGATVVNDLAIWEIAKLKQRELFRRAFPPFGYGTSRFQIGGGRLGNDDGSLGSWFAEGTKQYGVLPFDAPNCPKYTKEVAKLWGRTGPPREHLVYALPYRVRTVAPIKSYVQMRDAAASGYWMTYASDRGHEMMLKYDPVTKKHWWTGRDVWPHQRPVRAVDDDPRRPGIFLDNQWGPDAHGPQADGPAGGGWWDAEEVDKDLRRSGTECIAFSLFDGYPDERSKPSLEDLLYV